MYYYSKFQHSLSLSGNLQGPLQPPLQEGGAAHTQGNNSHGGTILFAYSFALPPLAGHGSSGVGYSVHPTLVGLAL